MKKFAVAYINFLEAELQLKVVSADTWRGALSIFGITSDVLESLPDNYEEALEEANNQDWQFSVIELAL